MKRLRSIILALAICLTASIGFRGFPVSAAGPRPVVYVSGEGRDENTGASPEQALLTLTKAFEVLGGEGGTISLEGEVSLEGTAFSEPSHAGKVTVTGGTLVFPADFLYTLGGSTLFESMALQYSGSLVFAAGFHPIEFGEGLITSTDAEESGIVVVGGFQAPVSGSETALDSHITIRSGDYQTVCGFSRKKGAKTQTYTGTSHIRIDGGTVQTVYGAALENHYCQNAEITVNGGAVGMIYAAGDATRRINGNADIFLNGGSVGEVVFNNVIGEGLLSLDGSVLHSVSVSYGSSAVEALCVNSVLKLRYNSILYTAAEAAELGASLDELLPYGRVYVKSDGSGDGLTPETPSDSLANAISLLSQGGGTVVLLDAYPVSESFEEPAHSSRITLTGGALSFPEGAVYRLGGPLNLDGVALRNAGELTIDAGIHSLTAGESCPADAPGAIILQGDDLFIADGSFGELRCGSKTVVSGGWIGKIILSGSSSLDILKGEIASVQLPAAGNPVVRLTGGSVGAFVNETDGGWTGSRTLYYNGFQYTEDTVMEYRPFFDKVEGGRAIFAADGGSGGGSSPADAAGSLKKAVEALGSEGGIVVVCGPLSISNGVALPEYQGQVIFTSRFAGVDYRETAGAQINFSTDLTLGGPSRFADITLEMRASSRSVYCNGHDAIFDTGVQVEKQLGVSSYLSVNGGGFERSAEGDAYRLTINSGRYHIVRGGNADPLWASHGAYRASQKDADIAVEVNGGEFYSYFCAGGDGVASGEVHLTINGGDFRAGIYGVGNNAGSFSGTIAATLNGGIFRSAIAPATSAAPELSGVWKLSLNGGDYQRVTDVKGARDFFGTMTSELQVSSAIDLDAEETGTLTFQNYLRSGADPWLFFHDGYYYLTVTGSTQVSVFKAMNFEDLSTAPSIVIFKPEAGQMYSKNLWSPEIHYFSEADVGAENAGWYLYIACDDGDNNNHRMYALKSLSGSPEGPYGHPENGEVNVPAIITNPDDPEINAGWCAGQTVLRHRGKAYALWVDEVWEEPVNGQQRRYQVEYLCEMSTPWILKGQKVKICEPTLDWEKNGATTSGSKIYPEVVEGGTAVYGSNGELYIIYSGSGYWTTFYQLGQLKLVGDNPLSYDSWEKSQEPIFSKSDEVNGCGHASYTTSPDGKTGWICYHAYTGTNTQSGRFVFVEPYTVDENGVTIGNGSGHPQPLSTKMEIAVNPMPLGQKLSGWDSQREDPEPSYIPPVPPKKEDSGSVCQNGWQKDSQGNWRYQNSDGTFKTGWFRDADGKWYYLTASGTMKTGWLRDTDGKWYYLTASGAMKTGWLRDTDGKWYYLTASGAMKTGWFRDTDGKWYYFYPSGSMASGTVVGGYRIGCDGAML